MKNVTWVKNQSEWCTHLTVNKKKKILYKMSFIYYYYIQKGRGAIIAYSAERRTRTSRREDEQKQR